MAPIFRSLVLSMLYALSCARPSSLHHGRSIHAVTNSSSAPLPPSQDPFYTAPPNFEAASPGTILRLRAAPGNWKAAVANSSAAYNILYRTTDSRYLPAWAVTTLFVPIKSTGDSLLSYQYPYDSADVDASPSYSFYSGPPSDLTTALGKGWYVNSPDYEGPLASFTAGVQSGHATLDSVRAVLSSGFGLSPNATYALFGYSGGALASEWAAELQVQYAPELNFSGIAIGGLTPNITETAFLVNGTLEAGLVPGGILGLASQHPELKEIVLANLKANGTYNATGFLAAANKTLAEAIGTYQGQNLFDYFVDGVALFHNPTVLKVLNSDGVMGYHGFPQMPVFAYKAIADEVSNVTLTDALIEKYCGVGVNILYQRNVQGEHVLEEGDADAMAFEWLETVFNGTYATAFNATGCTIQNISSDGTTSVILNSTRIEA